MINCLSDMQVKYSLSRQSDGNLIWYIYGEFASVEDYNKHASQQYEHVSLGHYPVLYVAVDCLLPVETGKGLMSH